MRKMRFLCVIAFLLCLCMQKGMAQVPKWVEKAKQAVFSVITYDKSDKILNTGNGFFVSEDGIALSDFSLFKGANRAVIITAKGEQMPVVAILGADDMYDVVKFRVDITSKKVPMLVPATTPAAIGASVYVLPYSTQKDRTCSTGHVKVADTFSGKYSYYTLDMHLKEKMVSCPVMNEEGQVLALAQKSSGQDTATICYGVGADYVMSLSITPFAYSDIALQQIGIKKALPDTEEQALVFLYMASSQLSPEKYAQALDDFVAAYPESADGYIRRATNRMQLSQEYASIDKVVADLDEALKVTNSKDDVYYNRAKLIYNYNLTAPKDPYQDWSYDKALTEIGEAIAIRSLPVYMQLKGDILFAKQDYEGALSCYQVVDTSSIASPVTFFSTARTKELLKAPVEEVLALMDSCVSRFSKPYTEDAAPYLLERARVLMNADKARLAMADYDAYYDAVKGNVNDVFYYYREQAAMKSRQYQRALDDIAKAIELNPKDVTYRAEYAVINIRVGRSDEAVKILQEALKVDANYAEVYRLMGLAYVQLKQKEQACTSFAKAKEMGDPNVDALIEKYCK